jgi:hypothetical protein
MFQSEDMVGEDVGGRWGGVWLAWVVVSSPMNAMRAFAMSIFFFFAPQHGGAGSRLWDA